MWSTIAYHLSRVLLLQPGKASRRERYCERIIITVADRESRDAFDDALFILNRKNDIKNDTFVSPSRLGTNSSHTRKVLIEAFMHKKIEPIDCRLF